MLKKLSLGKRIKDMFGIGKGDESFFEELEELLIKADLGPQVAMELIDELKLAIKQNRLKSADEFLNELKAIISGYMRVNIPQLQSGKVNVLLVLGVNGVGKTTSIAKIAQFYKRNHKSDEIILSAADTFRAAAVDQLKLWGERLKLKVIHQAAGADPGAVVFDSVDSALAKKAEVLLIDTSGRMHNKEHLVRELGKIDKIITNKSGLGNYHKLLVIDATTGQNALRQAEVFHEALRIDSVLLAKYDSAAKGGMAVSLCKQLGLAFSFLGNGEKLDDVHVFSIEDYVNSLIGN
jgi:fused signal recognition particle receptor